MEYNVTWTIDVDADSPEEAARAALEMQRRSDSWATHFEVQDSQGYVHEVDLGSPDESSNRQTVHVLVPMEEGIVRGVRAFRTHDGAKQSEHEWLRDRGLAEEKARDHASNWGTGVAIWECPMED